MLDQAKEANAVSSASPYDKHVDVLLKTSALCREMAGIVTILCKSGVYNIRFLTANHYLER